MTEKPGDTEQEQDELDQGLSDIYSTLRQDARSIISDLEGGVTMWREAAAGAAASAGFILILVLTSFRFYPPSSIGGWAYVIGASGVGVIMAVLSAWGFWKYSQLKKKYAGLFQRARSMP